LKNFEDHKLTPSEMQECGPKCHPMSSVSHFSPTLRRALPSKNERNAASTTAHHGRAWFIPTSAKALRYREVLGRSLGASVPLAALFVHPSCRPRCGESFRRGCAQAARHRCDRGRRARPVARNRRATVKVAGKPEQLVTAGGRQRRSNPIHSRKDDWLIQPAPTEYSQSRPPARSYPSAPDR
jgi:hypothetical protein